MNTWKLKHCTQQEEKSLEYFLKLIQIDKPVKAVNILFK